MFTCRLCRLTTCFWWHCDQSPSAADLLRRPPDFSLRQSPLLYWFDDRKFFAPWYYPLPSDKHSRASAAYIWKLNKRVDSLFGYLQLFTFRLCRQPGRHDMDFTTRRRWRRDFANQIHPQTLDYWWTWGKSKLSNWNWICSPSSLLRPVFPSNRK